MLRRDRCALSFWGKKVSTQFVPGGELVVPPPGYTSSKVMFRENDGRALATLSIYYYKRVIIRLLRVLRAMTLFR
ncbi:hypothetical protein YC2023_035537 [Brassica napus]